MRPAQRAIIGTRMPPSHELPFIPRNPAVSPPNHGPLSEAKTTIVCSSSFSLWSASSTRPTFWSSSRITSEYRSFGVSGV